MKDQLLKDIKKNMLLGSGALRSEKPGNLIFGFTGAKSITGRRDYNVLINPNIATIQTSENIADKIYFLPVNPYFVEQVIKKERPDGILLSFGGQTALNCGVELFKNKIFEKYNVRVLEHRTIYHRYRRPRNFVKQIKRDDVKSCRSQAVTSIENAVKAAERLGYPILSALHTP